MKASTSRREGQVSYSRGARKSKCGNVRLANFRREAATSRAVSPSESQVSSKRAPTVEEQRQAARELVNYFKEKRLEEDFEKNQQLGWVPKAEIANGRWVMFGLLVGMLTEFSTGVNFIDQIKLLLVNLSIIDFD
eukprot:CAMPEP_0197486208 /NCGR_PEP_ID=MMETSP1311-20131121/1132_1 /TAXON_ID=464262 /ORGANISM="Genus nov. species nov., Strain RCC856" /LENGTH=134 /DNA_ID=CAMNT_0043029167 /DNA_START=167 /DNA_END=571 /DNA_ORIENTATION=+